MEDCRVRQAEPYFSGPRRFPVRVHIHPVLHLFLVFGRVPRAADGRICSRGTFSGYIRVGWTPSRLADDISVIGKFGVCGGSDCGGSLVSLQGRDRESAAPTGEGEPDLPMTPGGRLVSIVLSFRNEAQNIPEMVARIDAVFASQPEDDEIVFVNDRSSDRSLEVLAKERSRNPRVKILNMSRRLGVSECVRAGMAKSKGDAIIYMDADLQDPPEVVPKLLEQWRQGAQVVHTVRMRRAGENPLKTWLTRQAYRVIRFGSSIELPVEAGDFKLLSRQAVRHMLALTESDPLPSRTRGMDRFHASLGSLRAGGAACRNHAFPDLQPQPLENAHRRTDLVFVPAGLSVRPRGFGRVMCLGCLVSCRGCRRAAALAVRLGHRSSGARVVFLGDDRRGRVRGRHFRNSHLQRRSRKTAVYHRVFGRLRRVSRISILNACS